MKPKLGQEIWHIGHFANGKYLEKMEVGYIGNNHFICHEQLGWEHIFPIAFISYGVSWFIAKEKALEWLDKHGYEWNDHIRAYTKKGE